MSATSHGSVGSRGTVATAAGLGLVISAVVTVVRLQPGSGSVGVLTLDDLHEGQLELAEAMVLILVGALLAGRFRRQATSSHLLLVTAFCVLALDQLVAALFTAGLDSVSTSTFATWSTTGVGLVATGTLVLAAALPAVSIERPGRAVALALGTACLLVGVVMGTAWVSRDRLPEAFETLPELPADLTLLGGHPVLAAGDVLTAALWAVSAGLFARTAERTGDRLTRWLAVACVLSAVSSVNYALVPTHVAELAYLGDYFFLGAVVVLLVAAARAIGEAEASRIDGALYAERRRIAREMHDGVTQELAYIATQAQLIAGAGDPSRSSRALRRIQESVDRALDQSRVAIHELSGPVDEPLSSAIALTATVVGNRAGARLELHMDDSVEVEPDVRSALLSITRDAVGHAARSCGAENIRIDLWSEGSVGLRITDDGRATTAGTNDPDASLLSIREQADAVSGVVTVSSTQGAGSTLQVVVP